ncbi:MAG TPA: DUF2520 domain-containing protein [Pyrinomonadaceae bacterium]|jgi:predicted short-subunit dehydrogenase-like oxidoreductase (DUF2520 family)
MKRKAKSERGEKGKRGRGKTSDKLAPFSLSTFPHDSSVSIIGAGRLGVALGIALAARGFEVEAIVARRLSHARRAAKLIGQRTRALSSAQLDKLKPASIVFITTPDDVIESVAEELAASIKGSVRGSVALHASGALSSEVLHALRAVGFETGSMHPLISVSDPLVGAESLAEAHFCIEGQPRAARLARSLVRSLGGRSFSIKTKDKALYHAAAVMSSGHVVALFDLAAELLESCGLSNKQSRAALLPLMKSTLENLSRHTPARALTGTFARADLSTVIKHLAALQTSNSREALRAYALLGLRSIELAKENGADALTLKKISSTLQIVLKNEKR